MFFVVELDHLLDFILHFISLLLVALELMLDSQSPYLGSRLVYVAEPVSTREASAPDRHRIWEAFLPRTSAISLGLLCCRATNLT